MKSSAIHLIVFALGLLAAIPTSFGQDADTEADVRITTEYGNVLVKLYDETPKHKENFLKLVSEGFYDSLLFHRVIEGFMIQGGDPQSKTATPGQPLGNGGLDYLIDAEFNPNLYHKKGALAAARQPDQVNPEQKSSACQFYIVQGRISPSNILESMAARRNQKNPGENFSYSEKAVQDYSTIGGAPHLDGGYTVFGEVVEGIEVIDKIAAVDVDGRNRPLSDVRVRIELIE